MRAVAAYRDNEAPPEGPLAVLLADLAAARLVTHRALSPLSPGETGQLFDALTGDVTRNAATEKTVRERVVRRSEGVPFYVVSFAQTARRGERGASGAPGDEGEAVPWDVAQGLRAWPPYHRMHRQCLARPPW